VALNILYFAWVREKVGIGDETVSPPASVETVAQLIDWLATQSPKHAEAFKNRTQIRAAVDQTHSAHSTKIAGAKEVAFFPPVTGG
jgi:molybdopterin synthase sulfur carrier subunit